MKILILNGHPNLESFTSKIANELKIKKNAKLINLSELNFNPIFEGFSDQSELEEDLKIVQNEIRDADHIIITSPIWWSTYPALLKGFFDRVLLPNFAFRYKKDSPFQEKLLQGKTAELYLLSDAPAWYRKYILRDPAAISLKRDILGFCGIKVTKIHRIGNVRYLDSVQRERVIARI
ncbi:NAD(P)H-dependent oxidoreductase [Bacteriovorax sp. Seq25_V]|uniref:NAD(P)H-dependent oxidoreductase n=1 Tax=Bacteriovorax sp. Seq25_V TaxID=1201288 RepID=UPI00038A3BC8|nr:NAD(P)H-dependent oxidoreductase [Bacteriovorax sp. Seq25_V]EQC47292.1 flavin reductase [Bacteriovorax sp. Seq25_V]